MRDSSGSDPTLAAADPGRGLVHEVPGVVRPEVVLKLLQGATARLGRELLDEEEPPTLISAKSPNVGVAPSAATSGGNAKEMAAFTVHSTNTAMPIANPRMVIGKISESSSHTSVPMNVCTKKTTTSIAARMR
jgi:hypothetical protein